MNNNFSVLILTYNEQASLAGCLQSLTGCDDVVVLDSYSNDATETIAGAGGARFYQRRFDNYAAQRSYGLDQLEFRHPWVLFIDADERATPQLLAEIRTVMAESNEAMALYRLRRKDYFHDRWLRRSSGYPTWFGRLVKRGAVRIEREINEEYVTEGRVGLLSHHLLHYPFAKGMAHWFDKHNRYSTMEAQLLARQQERPVRLSDLGHRDPAVRRKLVKSVFYRLPMRPMLMFIGLYLVRGGLLDGKAGLQFCLLRAYYEFMIQCKMEELRRES